MKHNYIGTGKCYVYNSLTYLQSCILNNLDLFIILRKLTSL